MPFCWWTSTVFVTSETRHARYTCVTPMPRHVRYTNTHGVTEQLLSAIPLVRLSHTVRDYMRPGKYTLHECSKLVLTIRGVYMYFVQRSPRVLPFSASCMIGSYSSIVRTFRTVIFIQIGHCRIAPPAWAARRRLHLTVTHLSTSASRTDIICTCSWPCLTAVSGSTYTKSGGQGFLVASS